MKIEVGRRFEKETLKLNDDLQTRIYEIILELEAAEKLDDLSNLKKLKGFKNAYRIKMGDYRIGLLADGDTLILSRVLHRKDIYRYFP